MTSDPHWQVSITNYPNSSPAKEYSFDTEKEALSFVTSNTDDADVVSISVSKWTNGKYRLQESRYWPHRDDERKQ